MITELSFKDPAVHKLVCKAFPGARTRRTVKVSVCKTYAVHEYWDGGSKDTHMFISLSTGQALSAESIPRASRQVMGNPFNLPIADVELSGGFCIVIESVFMGKRGSYRIILAEQDAHLLGIHVPAPALDSEVISALPTNEVPALPEGSNQ